MPGREALRRWDLSLTKLAPALAIVTACGGLDPIVAPDDAATSDATTFDGASVADASDEPSMGDAASDAAEAGSPFDCGNKVCDAKTHYCEKKGVADGGKADAGEVDTCIALPPTCLDDGGAPACACIVEQCAGNLANDAITVTCP